MSERITVTPSPDNIPEKEIRYKCTTILSQSADEARRLGHNYIGTEHLFIAATRNDLRYRIEEAWYRAKTSREVSTLFSTRLVPNAKQAYEVTLTGYSAGNSNFNDLIETWRQHLAYRLQLAQNRAQLGKATATLRAAAGIH